MLKSILLFKNNANFTGLYCYNGINLQRNQQYKLRKSRALRVENAKFLGYCFYVKPQF